MKKSKMVATFSLILAIISLIPNILTTDSIKTGEIVIIVGILAAISAIILGIIGKNQSKGLAVTGLVIGIISCALLLLSFAGFSQIKTAKNCVDEGNGIATCKLKNGQKIQVPKTWLTEDQLKEGE